MELEKEIRQFVIENFMFGEGGSSFTNEDSFLERGIIDSTGILELVGFLENKYQIKVQDEELVPDNLDSVRNLIGFINNKSNGKSNRIEN